MSKRDRIKVYLPWGGAILTGLLLAASFPPLEWKDLAWCAFVPLILAVRGANGRRAIRLAVVSGAMFWMLSLVWLTHVTYFGWMVLSLYCTLYFVPFVLLVNTWFRQVGTSSGPRNVALMVVGASTWCAWEFLRSTLLTGFAWNPLGVSQHANLTIVQIVSWTGVYGVSFVIVLVNMAFAMTIRRYVEVRGHWGRRWHPELMLALLIWALVHAHGWKALTRPQEPGENVRVALIQPNIPQTEKWTREHIDTIYDSLHTWSGAATLVDDVDLLVWPETALPDDVRNSPRSYDLVRSIATNGIPLLVGSMDTEWTDNRGVLYFNSSFLFDESGAIIKGYDKQHLVIFGEYVPFDKTFPMLGKLTPIQESFTAGQTGTVFRLEEKKAAFSVLICFEDTVSKLARNMVRDGARLLINQTNDAWFDASSGSRQHMLHCIFRCIECGVPAVRATNTGMTCAIDRRGRAYDILSDGRGNHMVAGFNITDVDVPAADMPLTFYARYGDLFAWLCVVVAGLSHLVTMLIERRRAGENTARL